MKQLLNINKPLYYPLAKKCRLFLLIICQLTASTMVPQIPPTLAMAFEFNTDQPVKIQDIPYTHTYIHESVSSTDFRVHSSTMSSLVDGLLGLEYDSNLIFNIFDSNSLDKFNPKVKENTKYGYTIMVKIQTGYSEENIGEQIFWVKDKNDKVIYGFKKLNNKLVFQRYARDFKDVNKKIIGTWDFDLWYSKQFDSNPNINSKDYTLLVSVTENLFRVKVYSSNYDISKSIENNTKVETCACELVYLGGQELRSDEISTVGFGSPPGSESYAISAIDYFRVYDNSISSFDAMDAFYKDNKGELPIHSSKDVEILANKELILDSNETNTTIDLEIFPNPINTEKELFARFNIKQPEKVTFQFFGLSGQLVSSESFNASAGTNKFPINIKGIRSGIYIIKTQGLQINKTNKIIIE